MSLVTVEELATFTQLLIPTGTPTVEAQAACDRATALVRAYCRRNLTQETRTDTVAVVNDAAELPVTPVASVTSVTIGGAAVTGYTLRADGALVFPTYYVQGTTATVTYVAGFPATDYRLEAARAVAVRVAARLWSNPDSRTTYTGPGELSYSTGPELVRLLTLDERLMLDPAVRVDGVA